MRDWRYLSWPTGHVAATLPCPEPPFGTLILDPDGQPDAVMQFTCEALVAAGCGCLLAWGPKGTDWDDAGDWAALLTPGGDLRQPPVDMLTAWCSDEPLEDALLLMRTLLDDKATALLALDFGNQIGKATLTHAIAEL